MKALKKMIYLLKGIFVGFVLSLGLGVLSLMLLSFKSHSYENLYFSYKEYDEYIDELVVTTERKSENPYGVIQRYFTISSDLYDQIEVGQKYSLVTKGWNSNLIFIDSFEEIVSIQQIKN